MSRPSSTSYNRHDGLEHRFALHSGGTMPPRRIVTVPGQPRMLEHRYGRPGPSAGTTYQRTQMTPQMAANRRHRPTADPWDNGPRYDPNAQNPGAVPAWPGGPGEGRPVVLPPVGPPGGG